jgi:hypothetical protein
LRIENEKGMVDLNNQKKMSSTEVSRSERSLDDETEGRKRS